MKKIILLFALFVACEANTANPPPEVLLSEEKMENILYDLSLLKTIKINRFGGETPKEILNNNYILRKYNITDSVLKQNQHYYAQSPKKMLAIYDRIYKRLEKVEDSIGILAKKEQAELEVRLQREKDSIEAKIVRDSLALIKKKDSLAYRQVKDSLSFLKIKDSIGNLGGDELGKLEATFEN